jgi:hypothetical protein
VTTRDLRDDPRDVDESVDAPADRVPMREPLDSLPAWWGPFVDDSDQQQLGGTDCDLAEHVAEFGEPVLEFAKSGPRRRFLVCDILKVSHWAGVYIAIDCSADRKVVLKISRHAIDREARLTARASHPNVITIFDAFVYRGYPTMVMEWSWQGTLAHYANRYPDWRQVLSRGIEAGRGLAHFHAQGKVHGDVKPENILVVDDVGKLADFGIARSATDDGDVAGTFLWAPPERFGGDWQPPGDVYSYAKTLVSVLKGLDGVPDRVWGLLKAAKSIEPEDRPTMLALLADLDRVLEPDPIARASMATEPMRSGSLSRRRFHWQVVAVAVSAAIVTSTVVLAAVCSSPDSRHQSTTQQAVETTLELAAESADHGDGPATVQYLEAGRLRAHRDFDQEATRLVADEAVKLGERLAELGDILNAVRCWTVARQIFDELHDRDSTESLLEVMDHWGINPEAHRRSK